MVSIGQTAQPFDCNAVVQGRLVRLLWQQVHEANALILLFDSLEEGRSAPDLVAVNCAVPRLEPASARVALKIVRELDKYVVGQAEAKRAVAVALRNRVRRQKLDPEMAEDVMPKNILMIGPTGVGKTEIARRLAKLANSPFLKVEASKFTEVGYVGRDVEAMIRDLVDIAIDMVREQRLEEVAERAERNAEERLLDLLMPPQQEASESNERTREKLREKFRAGKLDEKWSSWT